MAAQHQRLGDIVAQKFEISLTQQMCDVRLLAGEEIVDANHVMAVGDQPLAQVRAQKAGSTGNHNAFDE